jgi:hypothetical protein
MTAAHAAAASRASAIAHSLNREVMDTAEAELRELRARIAGRRQALNDVLGKLELQMLATAGAEAAVAFISQAAEAKEELLRQARARVARLLADRREARRAALAAQEAHTAQIGSALSLLALRSARLADLREERMRVRRIRDRTVDTAVWQEGVVQRVAVAQLLPWLNEQVVRHKLEVAELLAGVQALRGAAAEAERTYYSSHDGIARLGAALTEVVDTVRMAGAMTGGVGHGRGEADAASGGSGGSGSDGEGLQAALEEASGQALSRRIKPSGSATNGFYAPTRRDATIQWRGRALARAAAVEAQVREILRVRGSSDPDDGIRAAGNPGRALARLGALWERAPPPSRVVWPTQAAGDTSGSEEEGERSAGGGGGVRSRYRPDATYATSAAQEAGIYGVIGVPATLATAACVPPEERARRLQRDAFDSKLPAAAAAADAAAGGNALPGGPLRVSRDSQLAVATRWQAAADRVAEAKAWVALDRRMHPRLYSRVAPEDAAAYERDPLYRCAVPQATLTRLASLPCSPLAALAHCHNAAELRLHSLLTTFLHGSGEASERLRDQEAGARGVALAAVARGYVARTKPHWARSAEERDWVALDALLRPHLYLPPPPAATEGGSDAADSRGVSPRQRRPRSKAAPYGRGAVGPADTRAAAATAVSSPGRKDAGAEASGAGDAATRHGGNSGNDKGEGVGEDDFEGSGVESDAEHDLSVAGNRRRAGGFGGHVRTMFNKLLAYNKRVDADHDAGTAAAASAAAAGQPIDTRARWSGE